MAEPDVLPDGVRLCPEAGEYLRRAIRALEAGLLISAWNWTEKARAELDKVTDGVETGDPGQE